MGRICVVAIVWLLTCCPARVATVTRDSRNTSRRWNAVGGGCTCDRTFALSDVSAPHRVLHQWFSQLGVVDGWATRGRAKVGRANVQAKDVARVCCALALRCKRSLHRETIFSAFPVAPMYEMRFSGNLLQLKHVQRSSCPTVTLAGTLGPVYTC